MDLRCESHILFGILDNGVVEFKCRSRFCGAAPGVVVLHKFSASSGELLETKRYKDPHNRKQVRNASGRGPAVRTA